MKTRQYVSFDWAIKRLLRSKANFGVLEGLLSELLKENITILEVLESESNKDCKKHKQNVLDLKVKNSRDEIIIIEVQYDRDYSFFHRILWGTSRVVTEHLHEGDDYLRVHKVISVNLIYFDLGEGEDYIYHGSTSFRGIHKNDVLQLRANERRKLDKDSVKQVFPEYYLIKINRFDDLAKDTLDEWIYFLKNEEIKPEFTAQGLQEAGRVLAYTKLNKEEQIEYNNYIDHRRRRDSELRTQFSDGLEEGLEKGLEKGMEQGMEKGLEKGKRETARSMKKEGIPAEIIQKCTKLSLDEIDKL
ncbi:Rpn family recombination-promoting nuclease/putative transposase [Candidatus Electrothrix sp.]|uniref:Rpn family recombination-promoting nuclease/putative transposase n=1 Tax=Candidatus Electrothrix sp. TaxID=2170559 RepID=UPI004056485B